MRKAKFMKLCQKCCKGEMKYAEIYIHGTGYKHVCEECREIEYFMYVYPRTVDLEDDSMKKYPIVH